MARPESVLHEQPRPALSLFDSTSIIVGIIIGSAIYEIAPLVAGASQRAAAEVGGRLAASDDTVAAIGLGLVIGVWVLGGVVALVGALCYAELATAYPQAGGTYVFLSEAFGRSVGFAFAWAEFWIVRPGNIGAVAFVLARYGMQIAPARLQQLPHGELLIAGHAILILAILNAIGLQTGKWTQNVLTTSKMSGLVAIVLVAFAVHPPASGPTLVGGGAGLSLALILIMFAYGGWADMSFVAAEVREPQKNIFRALLLGTLTVVAIYLAINLAFVRALGVGGLARSGAVAAEILAMRFGNMGSRAISLLVVVSCLGAINGMLFAGSRVFYALGTHHPTFRWLGSWNQKTGVPLRSLALQTLVTLGLVVGFGLKSGGFSGLVVFTGPFYWGFIGLVGVALILLRSRAVLPPVTYRVPLYPLTPIIFAVSSGAMVWAAARHVINQRSNEDQWMIGAWWAATVVVTGLIVGLFDWHSRRR